MRNRRTVVFLLAVVMMIGLAGTSYAPGNKTYIDYYSDSGFTVLVGGETHGCAETPTSWGIVGQYRHYNVFPCGSEPEYGFMTCWVWDVDHWAPYDCPW